MYGFKEVFGIKNNSASPCAEIFGRTRVSVITESLIRIEKQSDGKFCDYPTQAVLSRGFETPEYKVRKRGCTIIIKTAKAEFIIMDGTLIKVTLADGRVVTDFGKGNLKGTRRTLDMTAGKVKLGDGIISRGGVALMDDSKTLLLLKDGTVRPRAEILGRRENGTDIYCFAYGNDYNGAVRDYYRLTGMTPLIPRFALGNWWSRYKAYTQDEYLTLMRRFSEEKIPITVATVDMDWHYTDVAKRFGKDAAKCQLPDDPIAVVKGCYANAGWTGYTWNEELFPDYREFLNKLHLDGYKVTLNLHPAQGVRCFEKQYREFAQFMGIDPESKKQIVFDITDPKFIEGYFRFLHHGYEDEGVDFWWLDWQQEKTTKVKGLDPLWALNHYHSLDMKRDGKKRPLTLSRFAGYGSHRYPLGFSGDAVINWAALDFQPYFTATASNIGYSWWSHDIGGHTFGIRDDELYIRWVQFGVFSPIMRLHSTKNEFSSKEPWKYSGEAQRIVTDFMRLRHKMIPYIYTMNRRTNADGIPLIRPVYYDYPEDENAYAVPNEYFFGSELIVCPITEKCNPTLRQGGTDVWLPEGKYTDFFTGRIYHGGKKMRMFRDTTTIPVLAKEGAVIPISADGENNSWQNPDKLEIHIFSGCGSFNMYEDDGETENFKNGQFSETLFEQKFDDGKLIFTIHPAEGDLSVIPEKRSYVLKFRNIRNAVVSGAEKFCFNDGCFYVYLDNVEADKGITVELSDIDNKNNPPKREMLTELFSKLQGLNDLKSVLYSKYLTSDSKIIIGKKAIRDAVEEINNME
ncbi:MAG: glycoside hydrolase family 31 protein [Clostridia bacterium]|nr:glycoside hydrolase family 31 protein [Clostridia bacterium]